MADEVDSLQRVSAANTRDGEIRSLFNAREPMIVRHDEGNALPGKKLFNALPRVVFRI